MPAPKVTIPQYTNWCFTFNNYEDEDIENLKNFEIIKYCVFGYEKGESETKHLQGYFEIATKRTIKGLKKLLLDHSPRFKFHFEPRFGSQKQAIAYCKKGSQSHEEWAKYGVDGEHYGDDYDGLEWGTKKKQGGRNDLDFARQLAVDYGMNEVTAKCNLQAIKTAQLYLSYNEAPRRLETNPIVIYIYGEPEAGKSHYARQLTDDLTPFEWDPYEMGKWWDGYDGHECVILDDIRLQHTSEAMLLKLLDRYSCQVQVKGGTRHVQASVFVITTLKRPEEFWTSQENCKQFTRRITITLRKESWDTYSITNINKNFDEVTARFETDNLFFKKLLADSKKWGGNTDPPKILNILKNDIDVYNGTKFIKNLEKCLEIEDIFDIDENDLPELVALNESQFLENIKDNEIYDNIVVNIENNKEWWE